MKITESKLRSIIKSVISESAEMSSLQLKKTVSVTTSLVSYNLKVSLRDPGHRLARSYKSYRFQADRLEKIVDELGGTVRESGEDTFEFLVTLPPSAGMPEEVAQKISDRIEIRI